MEMSRRTLSIMGSEINGDIVSSTIATKNHLQRLWMFVLTPDDMAYNHDFLCLTVFRLFESFFTFFFKYQCQQKVKYFCTAYCVDTVFISYKEKNLIHCVYDQILAIHLFISHQ